MYPLLLEPVHVVGMHPPHLAHRGWKIAMSMGKEVERNNHVNSLLVVNVGSAMGAHSLTK